MINQWLTLLKIGIRYKIDVNCNFIEIKMIQPAPELPECIICCNSKNVFWGHLSSYQTFRKANGELINIHPVRAFQASDLRDADAEKCSFYEKMHGICSECFLQIQICATCRCVFLARDVIEINRYLRSKSEVERDMLPPDDQFQVMENETTLIQVSPPPGAAPQGENLIPLLDDEEYVIEADEADEGDEADEADDVDAANIEIDPDRMFRDLVRDLHLAERLVLHPLPPNIPRLGNFPLPVNFPPPGNFALPANLPPLPQPNWGRQADARLQEEVIKAVLGVICIVVLVLYKVGKANLKSFNSSRSFAEFLATKKLTWVRSSKRLYSNIRQQFRKLTKTYLNPSTAQLLITAFKTSASVGLRVVKLFASAITPKI